MNKPYVIGIAGGSASGKTTFSNKLMDALKDKKVYVFHMDAYFLPPEQRQMIKAPITKKDYRDDNHPTSFNLNQLLIDLKTMIDQNEFQFIIIEGLLTLQNDAICDLLDLKLFVDCQADERIVRRLRRNMKERGLSFDEIADVYLDAVRYRHQEFVESSKWRADFILNGSNQSENAFQILVNHLLNM